jgi:hypothetical protein
MADGSKPVGSLLALSVQEDASGKNYLRLRYHRPVYAPQTLEYIHEVSSDLETWSQSSELIEVESVVDLGNAMEQVTVKVLQELVDPDHSGVSLFVRVGLHPVQ